MTYFLTAYNPVTRVWDTLDYDVPASECEVLRNQLLEDTEYVIINIVPEA